MVINNIPDDVFQRTLGMPKTEFNKMTAEQRQQAMQMFQDNSTTAKRYGGSLRSKMKY